MNIEIRDKTKKGRKSISLPDVLPLLVVRGQQEAGPVGLRHDRLQQVPVVAAVGVTAAVVPARHAPTALLAGAAHEQRQALIAVLAHRVVLAPGFIFEK